MSSTIDPGNATDAYIARELGVESPRDVREDVDTLTAFGTPGKQKRLRVSTIRELMAVLHDLGLITNDYREPITLPASFGGGGGAVSSVSDSASIDMTLFSGNLSAVAIFGTTSGTVAEGDHDHTGVYAPVSHTHPESDITGLVADLAGKANASHTHTSADITNFNEAVDDRVGALILDSVTVDAVYDDSANTMTFNVIGGGGGLSHQQTVSRAFLVG